eukprot:COSAG02_NODE_1534_length_12054_cov_22.784442_13_plen_40_part_00
MVMMAMVMMMEEAMVVVMVEADVEGMLAREREAAEGRLN